MTWVKEVSLRDRTSIHIKSGIGQIAQPFVNTPVLQNIMRDRRPFVCSEFGLNHQLCYDMCYRIRKFGKHSSSSQIKTHSHFSQSSFALSWNFSEAEGMIIEYVLGLARLINQRWDDLPMDCLVNVLEKVGMRSLLLDVPFVCKSCEIEAEIDIQSDRLCFESLMKAALKYVGDVCHELKGLSLPQTFTSLFIKHCKELIGKCKHLELLSLGGSHNLEEDSVTDPHSLQELLPFKYVGCFNQKRRCGGNCQLAFPTLGYLILRKAYIDRVIFSHYCEAAQKLVLLDARDCSGFDEGDVEISVLAFSYCLLVATTLLEYNWTGVF
ncbi:hypothetical protein L3X38_002686 [Prunus dulcis]|uniref:Uncharacterized protein n=1 Tax=Prunus dulcis TaxID=3755 RepID=A0AAD4WXP4_PRUDU|nr:hypothetical protein L3X38_002686 [Prunus dulcis]